MRELPSQVVSRGLRPGLQALFVACILVASTAMFALAERRKLDRATIKALVLSAGPAVKGEPRPAIFSPSCVCSTRYARISFRLGKPGPLVAWIVSPTGTVVDRIGDFENVRRVTLIWSGRNQAGKQVADGSYRLRLKVAGATRTLPVFVVVRTKPLHFGASVAPRRLTLNGDGIADHAVITWHSPVQLFNVRLKARDGTTQTITRIYRHNRSYSFQWPKATCGANGCHVEHRPAPGAWTLQLLAEDVAGNFTSKPLGTVQVAKR
jgi:hypothetical protein